MAIRRGYSTLAREIAARPELNIRHKDANGETVLFYAVRSNDVDLVQQLMSHKNLDINYVAPSGATVLVTTIYPGLHINLETVRALLKSPTIDINGNPYKGHLPLITAAANNRSDIMIELSKHPGFRVDVKALDGITPLSVAIANRYKEAESTLRQLGAK